MKIIKNIKEIDSLKMGEQYVIQPNGYSVQNPEKLNDFTKEIDSIQKAVEDKFATKEVIIKTDSELRKMKESELVEYGLSIGADVSSKYSKVKNIENIKLKQ